MFLSSSTAFTGGEVEVEFEFDFRYGKVLVPGWVLLGRKADGRDLTPCLFLLIFTVLWGETWRICRY